MKSFLISPITLGVIVILGLVSLTYYFGLNRPDFVARLIGSGVFTDCSLPANASNPICKRSVKFVKEERKKFEQKPQIGGFTLTE